jgi:leucyl aminopeptidase
MKISVSATPLADQKKDGLVVFFQGSNVLLPSGNATLAKRAAECIRHSAFRGEAGQVALFPLPGRGAARQLIAAGLGEAADFHSALLEQAAAAAVKEGRSAGLKSFATASSIPLKGVSETDCQKLIGRGAAWGTYSFDTFKSKKKKQPSATWVFCGKVKNRDAIRQAEAQGAALLSTADLANLPGNEAPPARIARWARGMARSNGLSCQVLGKTELSRKGCGGILSVAQGSAQDAKMIIIKHAGAAGKTKPIVLVGKTVTFDSGGISLKPGKNMGWMRYDKCGGMAVLAAMQMVARMKVKVPVVGILGAAENMPGSAAARPGDIIRAYNGKTIEVLNTDAEGRLILADALGLASALQPAAIVDLATLTGACIIALGSSAAAVLGNDRKLVRRLIDAGAVSGERLWQLPLYKDYTDDMKSDFADLANLSKSGGAGTATAAAFLQEFVPDDIPWAHLDIAGTAWLETPKPWQAPGATLFGSRLLAEWIAGME